MQIYHYDEITGECVGVGEARPLPLREQLPDDDVSKWQIPANATTLAPPSVTANQVAVFMDGAWQVEADHRGETWFRAYNEPVTITAIGSPAEELYAEEPAPTEDVLVAYANFKQWQVATGGRLLTLSGQQVPFATSETSLSMMNCKVARLQQPGAPAEVQWQTGATTFAIISAADFISAATQCVDFVQATFDALPAIFADVNAGVITTLAQIDARLLAI